MKKLSMIMMIVLVASCSSPSSKKHTPLSVKNEMINSFKNEKIINIKKNCLSIQSNTEFYCTCISDSHLKFYMESLEVINFERIATYMNNKENEYAQTNASIEMMKLTTSYMGKVLEEKPNTACMEKKA